MCKKCPKNLTATVRFHGDRTGTVRILPFSHRTAPVTHNRSICDWGFSERYVIGLVKVADCLFMKVIGLHTMNLLEMQDPFLQ